ncbi:hypothetical protein LK09_10405 [Microbacterium mangrovi]|uniref:DUF4349 domain-containing protein n=1 Tax=Microbacterium mangrovi TaxID=1348253 RepID=A0A0B2A7N2_9MICO|nr:DUF4349 domain-containing protein [Microbacterium mangrovi]KHK97616.1 hypothetical protein LK09_10405 [Microbacterium mangrovi]
MTEHSADERPPLPELSEERIDEMERALLAEIDRERRSSWNAQAAHTDRRRHRRRLVIGWSGAAALVVIAAIAAGPVLSGLGPQASSSGSMAIEPGTTQQGAPDTGSGRDASGGTSTGGKASGGASSESGRQIVATAQATVQVDDVAAAAKTIAAAAAKRGGYVESMNIGMPAPGPTIAPQAGKEAASPASQSGTITVRVPSDQLVGAVGALSALGTVQSTSISQQDVTSQAIDLRAQVDALQASVTRLTELMRKSASVADLLTAETALSQRQADLEAAQQQLKALENQVAMSSLTVTLVEKPAPAAAAPSGFGDGLTAGWNGLVAVFDAVVVALGFLLPWLVIAAVVAVIVWLVLRTRRRRRATPAPDAQED